MIRLDNLEECRKQGPVQECESFKIPVKSTLCQGKESPDSWSGSTENRNGSALSLIEKDRMPRSSSQTMASKKADDLALKRRGGGDWLGSRAISVRVGQRAAHSGSNSPRDPDRTA
jgi:hypothetical protein